MIVDQVKTMNITIVGAGNIGTQFAAHCAQKGHNVVVYSSKPECINNRLFVVNEKGQEICSGRIHLATNNEKIAFEEAEIIFVTMPAYCMEDIAHKIYPFVKKKTKICLVPGTGGGECAFKKCIEKGATIFGIQRVPSVARLVEYGKIVKAVGYRNVLYVGALPAEKAQECSELLESIFDIKCLVMSNYLNLTLTPSNPILHTTRLRILYKDYEKGVVYKKIPLFYEEWDDESSELLLKCDDEVKKICHELKMFDLSYVKSLREHYESTTIEAMTNKIKSIEGFKGLKSPAIQVENGYIPDFSSRYFKADFSYGLSIIVQIANLFKIHVPYMNETLQWYYRIVSQYKEFRYTDYEITNKEEFVSFYKL